QRIMKRLQEKHIPFSEMKSASDIRRWNNGEIPVALIHPASAGHGLNLQQGGSCLVWFGLTWSLELYSQTNARLYRQGQQSQTVIIQHIITKGTIDEHIVKALQEKDKTQTALMDTLNRGRMLPEARGVQRSDLTAVAVKAEVKGALSCGRAVEF
ncbi:MAG: hypothetical protein LUG91_00340, partial [Ruminococcus sp.]|nr:hypothetical protein [Ruminococcus sp.]